MAVNLTKSFYFQYRWGNTPIDEGQKCGSKPLMKILEAARATHL